MSDGQKLYVIMAYSWSYNDEYNYTDENDAGLARVAYRSKVTADKACEDMNIAGMQGNDLCGWNGHGLEHLVNGISVDDFVKLGTELGLLCSDSEFQVPNDFPLEKCRKLYEKVNLRWYVVKEVPYMGDDLGPEVPAPPPPPPPPPAPPEKPWNRGSSIVLE